MSWSLKAAVQRSCLPRGYHRKTNLGRPSARTRPGAAARCCLGLVVQGLGDVGALAIALEAPAVVGAHQRPV